MKTSQRTGAGGVHPQQELLGSEVLLSVGFVPQKLLHLRQNRQRQLWKNLQKQKKQTFDSAEDLQLLLLTCCSGWFLCVRASVF